MNPVNNDAGKYFAPRAANVPLASTGATRNSAGIDRATPGGQLALSCKLVAQTGAVTGGPATQTLDAKLQDSADNSTFADYVPPRGVAADAAIAQITAVNTMKTKDIDLSTARRYVRVVEVAALTGGASPTLAVESHVVLGGADGRPVV